MQITVYLETNNGVKFVPTVLASAGFQLFLKKVWFIEDGVFLPGRIEYSLSQYYD